MIDIERRSAFASAFAQYHTIIEQFVINTCRFHNPLVKDEMVVPDNRLMHAAMQICMAQFCVRMMQTRAIRAPTPLRHAVNAIIDNYHSYKTRKIGSLAITSPPHYRQAIQQIEQNMSDIIMHALQAEANGVKTAALAYASIEDPPEDILPPEDFDEAGFWHDVFLSLTMNQRSHHPNWMEPVQTVVLNNIPDLRAAFNVQ